MRKIMKQENLDALLLARNVDVFYATGIRFVFVVDDTPLVPQSTALITQDEVIYSGRLGPFDTTAVAVDTSVVDLFEYVDTELQLVDIMKKYGVGKGDRIGTEIGEGRPLGILPTTFEALKKRVWDKLSAQFVDAHAAIWKMRAVKSKTEVERMRKAVVASAKAMERCYGIVEIGMNELELARRASMFMLEEGAEKISHAQVMAHYDDEPLPFDSCAPLDRKIRPGYVSLDLGARCQGYTADVNRGIMLGRKLTEDERKLYECRVGFDELMEKSIKPGVSTDELLTKAVEYVTESGCTIAERWAGHGIGLEIHERPELAPAVAQPEFQNDSGQVILEPGMTFTFEPAITRGKYTGFDIEDDIVVTDTGCEVMNAFLGRELCIKP
jgi:Xaa-Pro aminopeptidase